MGLMVEVMTSGGGVKFEGEVGKHCYNFRIEALVN